jgi:hypothetical protein
MAALPPPLDSRSQPGRAAGIGAAAFGTAVALAVAALFLLLIGAHRSGWTAGEEYPAGAHPTEIQAMPVISRSCRGMTRQTDPDPTAQTPTGHGTNPTNKGI